MTLNFSQLWRYEDLLAQGTLMTLLLTVIAAGAGTLIGVGGAVLVRGGPRPVRWAIRGYIEVIRNTPALIQLFIIFFVLPSLGLRLPPFEAAAVALSIYFGAYAIEIIRAGVDAVPKGQWEAGFALGLRARDIFRIIVLKPALRAIYPSLTSQFVLLTLNTAICTSISALELTSVGQRIEDETFRSFEVYFTLTAIYLVLSLCVMALLNVIGKRMFHYPTK